MSVQEFGSSVEHLAPSSLKKTLPSFHFVIHVSNVSAQTGIVEFRDMLRKEEIMPEDDGMHIIDLRRSGSYVDGSPEFELHFDKHIDAVVALCSLKNRNLDKQQFRVTIHSCVKNFSTSADLSEASSRHKDELGHPLMIRKDSKKHRQIIQSLSDMGTSTSIPNAMKSKEWEKLPLFVLEMAHTPDLCTINGLLALLRDDNFGLPRRPKSPDCPPRRIPRSPPPIREPRERPPVRKRAVSPPPPPPR